MLKIFIDCEYQNMVRNLKTIQQWTLKQKLFFVENWLKIFCFYSWLLKLLVSLVRILFGLLSTGIYLCSQYKPNDYAEPLRLKSVMLTISFPFSFLPYIFYLFAGQARDEKLKNKEIALTKKGFLVFILK